MWNKKDHKEERYNYRLWKIFRLTPEDKQAILDYQKAHPQFCLLLGGHIGVDHHHKSGQIRGVLDWRINRGYGLLEAVGKENTGNLLRALAEYHDNPPAVPALNRKVYGMIGRARVKKHPVYGSENGPIKIKHVAKPRKKAM